MYKIDTKLAQIGNRSEIKQEQSMHLSTFLLPIAIMELANPQVLTIPVPEIQHDKCLNKRLPI